MEISEVKVDATFMAFEMRGAREIIQLTAGAVHIEHQVKALESAIVENPGLAIDLIKALIESVCITILKDLGKTFNKGEGLGKIVKKTLKELNLLHENPDAATSKVIQSLNQTATGLADAVQGICELRNLEGFASHGKDAYFQSSLKLVQLELAARAADALVNFLFKINKNYTEQHSPTRLIYQDHTLFNEHVDENNPPVTIFGLIYTPSEVLYLMDKEAYREQLLDYKNQESTDDDNESEKKYLNDGTASIFKDEDAEEVPFSVSSKKVN